MIAVSNYFYQVRPNEKIDIIVTAIGVPSTGWMMSIDGTSLFPHALSESQLCYTIVAAWASDTVHFCSISANFFPDSTAPARFEISVVGSLGGEGAFTVRPTDAVHIPEITFYCLDETVRGHAEIEPPEPWPRPKGHM